MKMNYLSTRMDRMQVKETKTVHLVKKKHRTFHSKHFGQKASTNTFFFITVFNLVSAQKKKKIPFYYVYRFSVDCIIPCRPDMTFAVDWALKANLSIIYNAKPRITEGVVGSFPANILALFDIISIVRDICEEIGITVYRSQHIRHATFK